MKITSNQYLKVNILKQILILFVIVFPYSIVHAEELILPIHEEPKHHLVYDGEIVQIMDVQIPPADITLYHIHDRPILYVSISSSFISSQVLGREMKSHFVTDDDVWQPGNVAYNIDYVKNAVIHRVENTGTNLFRIIAVLNKKNQYTDNVNHADTSLPGKVELNNQAFHQSRVTIGKDESIAWEATVNPVVFVQTNQGNTTVLYSDGSQDQTISAGEYIVEDSGRSFEVTNKSNKPITFVIIELH